MKKFFSFFLLGVLLISGNAYAVPATNEQVQQFVNNRLRVRVQEARDLLLKIESDIAAIDDVYANLTNSPTWTDTRTDAPPHLLEPNDVLGIHAFMVAVKTAMREHNQLPVVLEACVNAD